MKKTIFVVLVLVMTLAACGPAVSKDAMMDKPTEAMMEKPTDAMMDKPTAGMIDKPTEVMMDKTATPTAPSADTMLKSPDWFGATLTNARSGEDFMIKDFEGKVVVVEMMAMWCPTCKRQQGEVKTMLGQLGMPADLVVVALDIDPNEDAAALKAYADANGFDWIYAIAGAEVAREIGNLYDSQLLNPPSAPMLLIDRKGQVHILPFGVKSADDLIQAIKPLLEAGM